MPTTMENLQEAFAGEGQANQRYRAFAKKAEQDGFPNIARLFKTTAEAERIHAEGHLKAMDAVGSSVENLETSIKNETYEYTEMYPPMLEQAIADGHKAKRMFGYTTQVERIHATLYKLALAAAKQGVDLSQTEFYLCPVCGNIEFGKPTDPCPVCGTLPERFFLVS